MSEDICICREPGGKDDLIVIHDRDGKQLWYGKKTCPIPGHSLGLYKQEIREEVVPMTPPPSCATSSA